MFGPTFLADPANAPLIGEWEQRLAGCSRSGIAKAVRGVADRASVEPEVASIAVPVQVIVGADDAATPPVKSRRIADLIPGARLEQVPDCGHSSTLEQPAAVTRLIRDFLRT
jgi:pimeloyl-ACP methyl ester carboxylesterase